MKTRRRNPRRRMPPRYKSGPKKGQFRSRKRRASAKRRRPARRRKRATARRPAKRRRPRRLGGRKVRYRSHRGVMRKYGVKRGTRKWRRSRKYIRSNPYRKFLPNFKELQKVFKLGLCAYGGWIGVNGGMVIADRVGLARIREQVGPAGGAGINMLARLILIGPVCWFGGKIIKSQEGRRALLGGAAFNAVFHGARDVMALMPGTVPDAVAPLLLGYEGAGDYVASGVSDYIEPGEAPHAVAAPGGEFPALI